MTILVNFSQSCRRGRKKTSHSRGKGQKKGQKMAELRIKVYLIIWSLSPVLLQRTHSGCNIHVFWGDLTRNHVFWFFLRLEIYHGTPRALLFMDDQFESINFWL